ncbi:MAG: class I SAM-dependent methyltransferase [Chitinivibrionales bacterium]
MDQNEKTAQPDYGVDGSPFRVPLICIGLWVFAIVLLIFPSPFLKILGALFLVSSLLFTVITVKFIYYIKAGKFRLRDRLLSMVDWKGNETVLDIGTGRGLLMIGAAKRLTGGKSIGIDIWSQVDMYKNNPQDTLKNAQLEGVSDKVEVKNEDAQKMPFPDSYFDIVLSNLCIHNIPTKEGREKACREIARVLKPGGKVIISDILRLKDYAQVFSSEGMSTEILGSHFLETVTPWHGILKASK